MKWTTNRTGLIVSPRRKKGIVEVPAGSILKGLSVTILICATDKNPKAFGYANPGRLAKQAVRSHDV